MAIKVNEFVIQAKINESKPIQRSEDATTSAQGPVALPDSYKQEIIDECLEIVKRMIDERSE